MSTQVEWGKIKCMIVGNNCAGKSSLALVYKSPDGFPAEHTVMVADYYSKFIMIDGKPTQLSIHDTQGCNGHKDYHDRLRPLSYVGTDVFLICFAIHSRAMFQVVKTKWAPEIKHHCPDAKIFIIRTMDDLRQELVWCTMDKEKIHKLIHGYASINSQAIRMSLDISDIIQKYLEINNSYFRNSQLIKNEQGQELCKEIGAYKYMSCSALKGTGVNEIFDEVIECYKAGIQEPAKSAGCACHLL